MTADQQKEPLRVGVLGLGMAASVMVSAIADHPDMVVAAAADLDAGLRERFARDFPAPVFADAQSLLAFDGIDAVYIATPHQFHREHAVLAAARGLHVIVEKPMALTLADCDAMILAAETHGTALVIGHTHSFDEPVRVMRETMLSGGLGRLVMLSMWNYTDFLYRPRRPEELDSSLGGGILFNQLPHQVDIARLLAGQPVRSVRAMTGVLDRARPTEGHCMVFMEFEDGAGATLTYSGYDRFDSDELHGWVGATGRDKTPSHGRTRRTLKNLSGPDEEAQLRRQRYGYGSGAAFASGAPAHQPHFGIYVVSCENGDIRQSPDGLRVYSDEGVRDIVLAAEASRHAGRTQVLDELLAAVREGEEPPHGGRFARETLEVCLAVQRSARERREVLLR